VTTRQILVDAKSNTSTQLHQFLPPSDNIANTAIPCKLDTIIVLGTLENN